jgi:hypothetical protein
MWTATAVKPNPEQPRRCHAPNAGDTRSAYIVGYL